MNERFARDDATTFAFANEGVDVVVDRALPHGAPKAVVPIAHGMAEHARFAGELAARGYAVYAPDQRGHGRTARGDDNLGWAGDDGWNGMLRDLARLAELVRERHPAPGGRHEMLNETNRDDVVRDVIGWLDAHA